MALRNVVASILFCLVLAGVSRAQYFPLPGDFSYSLNSINHVFDVSRDGKIAVTLRNSPSFAHSALLTTFDPILGTQFDSETFGFGPLGVRLVRFGGGLRAVVLTSEGGPRTIYLFDVSPSGELTRLASTRLTNSSGDAGSNLVLSESAQAGFVLLATGELVTFSLVDGVILSRLPVSSSQFPLEMVETPGRRLLAFIGGHTLQVVDATNPSQPLKLGSVALPQSSGTPPTGIAFTSDARYVFAGISAIDLDTLQVVSSVAGNYRFGRIRIHEGEGRRWLAVQAAQLSGGQSAFLLIDASDPSNLKVVKQHNYNHSYKTDLAFSRDGSRLYVATLQEMIAFNLPDFTRAWTQPLPASAVREHQIAVFGETEEEVLGAWHVQGGLGFTSMFGSFPAVPPNISVNDVTVSEGDSGAVSANFTVSLSSPTTHRVAIRYSTVDGTALKSSDYADTSGTITFEPGETVKTVAVPVNGDVSDEFDETFTLNLTNAGVGIVVRGQGVCTVLDDDPPPTLSIADATRTEGDAGTLPAVVIVSLSHRSGKPVTFNYSTADGTAVAIEDYVPRSGSATIQPGAAAIAFSLEVMGDNRNEPDEHFFLNISSPVNATIAVAQARVTIINNDTPRLQFAQTGLSVGEVAARVTLTVMRAGDASAAATVDYQTGDADTFTVGCADAAGAGGNAFARCDFATAVGTLSFAPNETSKSIIVPIIDDAHVEGSETFQLRLSSPTGATLGTPNAVSVTISDNDSAGAQNPIVSSFPFFVRQQYLDFLSREPDPGGFDAWLGVLNSCQPNAFTGPEVESRCDRLFVSGEGFFRSLEFQLKGFYVFRFYKLGLNRLPEYLELVSDMSFVAGQTAEEVYARKAQLATRVTERTEFKTAYDGLTNSQYVNTLLGRYNLPQITTYDPAQPDGAAKVTLTGMELTARLDAGTLTRAQVLRAIADSDAVVAAESNNAFVGMQYYGYLRRKPDADGFNAWLRVLQAGNTRTMVNGFLNSTEYKLRFGQP